MNGEGQGRAQVRLVVVSTLKNAGSIRPHLDLDINEGVISGPVPESIRARPLHRRQTENGITYSTEAQLPWFVHEAAAISRSRISTVS